MTWKPATGWEVIDLDSMGEDLQGWMPKKCQQMVSIWKLLTLGCMGGFTMLSTFYQGQESSLGAWLSKGLASKEGWPWVGGKIGSWEVGLHPALLKAL